MAHELRNTVIAAALLFYATGGAAAEEWDDLLSGITGRGVMLCVAGGFSAYRYKAWAAWEGEREGVVYFAVRTVTWDGVETQDLARTEDSAPFANAFRVLVENGAWSLADARPVYGFGGPPLDLPTYYVTVADRVCRNSFSVFDPLGLDDKRYLVIVQALQSFFSDCGL